MRVGIAGQYGWNNVGDEAILQAIIDEIGWENEFVVHTSLPFNLITSYEGKVPHITDLRTLEDGRTDFDVYLLGGGKVDWGFGWRQMFKAIAKQIPLMAYGIGVQPADVGLEMVYSQFFSLFGAITVRDMKTERLFDELYAQPILTMCPAINLKEEKVSCPDNMIVVCPRYLDFNDKGESDNSKQIDWIVEQVQWQKDNVLLIPFAPYDMEGKERDLAVCKEIAQRLKGARIFNIDPYKPRQVKYILSRSRHVISGGRYHALVWAVAHNIPFSKFPGTSGIVKDKMDGFCEMFEKYGSDRLKEMERKNVEVFKSLI